MSDTPRTDGFPLPFRKSLERDIHDAMHPGGQHVGTARVTLEASRALRLLATIDALARERDYVSGRLAKYEASEIAFPCRVCAEAASALSKGEFSLTQRTAETLNAERYLYLRNVAGQYLHEEDGPAVCSGLSDLFEYHFGPEVDEVVDAAIERWKALGSPLPKVAP